MTPAELRKLIEAANGSGLDSFEHGAELERALVNAAPRILALMEAAEHYHAVADEITEVMSTRKVDVATGEELGRRATNADDALRAAVRDLREG